MSKNNDIFVKNNNANQSDSYLSISTPSDFASLKKNIQLGDVFTGGKRRSSRKGSKKGSKRGSRKLSGGKRRRSSKKGSRKLTGGKRRSRRASKKGSKKGSRKLTGGKRRSRKGSKKGSKRMSAGKRRSSKKASKKSSKKRSRKMSRGGDEAPKKKRQMPAAAKAASEAFRGLAMYIAKEMGLKFGAPILKLAGMYNNKAKAGGASDAISAAKKAREIFDKDSKDAREKMMKEAERLMAEKKAAKKAQSGGRKHRKEDDEDDDSENMDEDGFSATSDI